MNQKFNPLFWVITIVIPFFLIMSSVRLLVTPLFPEIEYRMPGFPDDSFGFTFDERLHWAKYSVNYLLNAEDISYLADLNFDNGYSLFNERELSHMVDVKVLVQTAINAWWGVLILLLVTAVVTWNSAYRHTFWLSLRRGGILTIGLIFLILIGIAISFQDLFTQFHHLFFQGDTWLFFYSDTLIRLFPLRFWQDAFIMMGVFTILGSLLLVYLEKTINKKA